ncbi:unnamed protein product [Prunus armeniaca]
MPLFWGYMPHFSFTPPDLPNSNPFGVVPWLSSNRFLPSSSRCIGVYDFGRDGDSWADCYSDPLSPRSIWFHILATTSIQQSEKSQTSWNLCRATARVLAPPLSSLLVMFPLLWCCSVSGWLVVADLWWISFSFEFDDVLLIGLFCSA